MNQITAIRYARRELLHCSMHTEEWKNINKNRVVYYIMLYTYIKILDFGFARNGVDKKEKEMKGKDEVKKWYKYTVKIKNEIKI